MCKKFEENGEKFIASFNNKNILNEIKKLLREIIGGEEITFNQFTDILDRDNKLRFYKRNSLLAQRERFFDGKENKRGKGCSKEIRMPLNGFVDFLDSLSRDGGLDLERFKKTIIYCINAELIVGK